MEIKLSVLFFCFIALPGVATQCPSGGKVSLTSGMQLTSLHKDNCLKLKFIYLFKCIEFTLIYFVFRTMRGSGRMREIPRWSEETRCRVITEYLLEVFHCSYFCIIFLIIPDIPILLLMRVTVIMSIDQRNTITKLITKITSTCGNTWRRKSARGMKNQRWTRFAALKMTFR